nr:decorin-binding protein DbpB [Borrelia sp. CA_690]WKC83975.1 decorin-binding protein DbpB [Borrelia sp. CA_690]
MKKTNLTITALFVSLLRACNFQFMKKIDSALESSSNNLKTKILQIKKEAAEKDVNFEAFTDSKTGSKVTNGGQTLRKAKVQAIDETEKFLKKIEEGALKLKEHGNSEQFFAMFDLMLEVVESLEAIGITDVKGHVLEEAESNPINTAERLIKAKVKIENQLEAIKAKQNIDGEKKNSKSKKKK